MQVKHPTASAAIILLMILCSKTFAFSDGIVLSQMYAQMLKEYETVIVQLKNIQVINDATVKMKDNLDVIRKEYKFVNSFNLESVLQQIEGDLAGLTNLDDLHNIDDTMGRIDALLADVDRRVIASDSPKAKKHLDALEKNSKLLDEAIKAYANEAGNAGTEFKTTADQMSGINSATSMLAAQTLSEKKESLEIKMRRTQDAMQHMKNDSDILTYFSGKKVK